MSEIRVDTISEKTSGSGTTVSNLKNPNQPFRNLVINGDMQIAQRATSATTAVSNTYNTVDRWKPVFSMDGAFTMAQSALSAADTATTGHQYALDIQCSTADTSIAAGHYAWVAHLVEANNCRGSLYGSDNAKSLTVSFWVKSNLTGTTCGMVAKEDSTYTQAPFEFTINSANTWEYKTVTIPANAAIKASAGAISYDNGVGLYLAFHLAIGGNYDNGTNLTWATGGTSYATTNQLNFLSSTDNDLFITGVQMEFGDTATDFEHVPFDVNLQRCQRYCEVLCDTRSAGTGTLSSGDSDESLGTVGVCHGTRYAYMPFRFSTAKRSNAPTLLISNDTNHFNLINTLTNDKFSTMTSSGVHSHSTAETYFDTGSTGNLTNGATGFVRSDVSGSKILVLDEL